MFFVIPYVQHRNRYADVKNKENIFTNDKPPSDVNDAESNARPKGRPRKSTVNQSEFYRRPCMRFNPVNIKFNLIYKITNIKYNLFRVFCRRFCKFFRR